MQTDAFSRMDADRHKLLAAVRRAVAQPPARGNAPVTAHKAASGARGRAPSQAVRVLLAVADRGAEGLTDWEGTHITGMLKSSYTARRRQLEQAGLVRNSGHTRDSQYGTANVVWVASPEVLRAALCDA